MKNIIGGVREAYESLPFMKLRLMPLLWQAQASLDRRFINEDISWGGVFWWIIFEIIHPLAWIIICLLLWTREVSSMFVLHTLGTFAIIFATTIGLIWTGQKMNTNIDPVACMGDYKIWRYATAPDHENQIERTLKKIGFMNSVGAIDSYIQKVAPGSPVEGRMILQSAKDHVVEARMMMAIMEVDSHYGTNGRRTLKTKNPGNVGNVDSGANVYHNTWEQGVEAVAKWLDKNRTNRILNWWSWLIS